MKTFFTFLTIITLSFSIQAQYVYNDFDNNQNETFLGWPNGPETVTNPDPSGINVSENVAEWVRGTEQYANLYCDLAGTINFDEETVFTLKVWAPIVNTVLFKLEGSGGAATEISQDVESTEEWVELSFDFDGESSGVFNKIVIFFDFASTTSNTFYFDDVIGPDYTPGSIGEQVDLPVTFDDSEVDYLLDDFGGNVSEIVVDPTDETNMVAKSIKTVEAATWAGTTVGSTQGFATPIPFEEGETVMSVAVWSPTANTPVRLKVEDATNDEISVETEVNTTVAEQWEILEFDFSNEAPGTAEINFDNTYDKASIFFNFGTDGATAGEQTYYWDDMIFIGEPTSISGLELSEVNVYPNPASDMVHVTSDVSFDNVEVKDISGRTIIHRPVSGKQVTIDVSALPEGIYLVNVRQGSEMVGYKKIIK